MLAVDNRVAVAALLFAVACTGEATGPLPRPTFENCYNTPVPSWFAYQNEGKNWTPVLSVGGGLTTIDFEPTPRVAVAYVSEAPTASTLTILYLTADELAARRCPYGGVFRGLSGSVSDFGGSTDAAITMGQFVAFASPTQPTYAMNYVHSGAFDIIAKNGSPNEKLIIRRGIDPPNNAAISALNFSSEGIGLGTLTLHAGGAGSVKDYYFLSANGTKFPFGGSAELPLPSVPGAATVSGDVHIVDWQASSNAREKRDLFTAFRLPADQTLSTGPTLSVPTVTAVTSGSLVLNRVQLASQPEYASYAKIELSQGLVLVRQRFVTIVVSAGYLGATPGAWDVSVPNFTTVAGFVADWLPQTGSTMHWTVTASSGAPFWENMQPLDGWNIRTASRSSP